MAHEPPAPPDHPHDPWVWCIALPALFALVAGAGLTTPSGPYFDEVHYLPAARDMLDQWAGVSTQYINREHPLFGKTLIALGMQIFGDNPLGWRIMPLIAGVVAMGASMRALWHASHDRFATIAFGALLLSGFHLFVQARIAMLDIFMLAFLALAAWQYIAAMREPETGRWRLALCGIAIGLALGSKWNAVPLAMAFGLSFLGARLAADRRRLFTSRRGIPVPGISLVEAFVWLGIVPLLVYAATFLPGYGLGSEAAPSPLASGGLIALHGEMLDLQSQVLAPHSYQSTWLQWVLNTRGIWYLYEVTDGAQRGVMLIGNPLTMLLGVLALVWCLWSGILRRGWAHVEARRGWAHVEARRGWAQSEARRGWARIGVVAGYAISLGLWVVAPKSVQFYYHYLTPSVFLLGALALTLSDLREAGHPRIAIGCVLASLLVFAGFYPILSAAPLAGPMSFLDWAWIDGWR